MDDRHLKVLLVEDDEDDYFLIRDWLAEVETTTFSLDWVRTYAAALETIKHDQHDVYLVDYRLGEYSGLDLIHTITERGCGAPVIMLTGAGNRAVDEEAMKAGAADYLTKGQLSSDMLERAIRYALERRRAAEALRKARDELELRVQERTAELRQANEALRAEITERQRTEQKLRHTERLAAVGTTTAILAHEIGNPLNGLSTTIQVLERHLIKRGYVTDDLLISTVHDLKNETNRLQSLLQELRMFARPQQLDCQPTNLAVVAAEVLRTQVPHYTKQGIDVEQLFPPELPLVMADSEKLAQVLLNLCKNAIEAMPEGGTLTVRGFQAEAQVGVEVQDMGHGVSEEVNIFDPFVTTKPGGTGLGLAIVRQIVEAHGGTITYTSTSGQGTTFTLALPTVATPDVT